MCLSSARLPKGRKEDAARSVIQPAGFPAAESQTTTAEHRLLAGRPIPRPVNPGDAASAEGERPHATAARLQPAGLLTGPTAMVPGRLIRYPPCVNAAGATLAITLFSPVHELALKLRNRFRR